MTRVKASHAEERVRTMYLTANDISQYNVTNDQLLFSNQMDSRVRGRSISDYAVKIFYLIPVFTYAATEVLICCLWNLVLRLVYGLCSLAHDSFCSNFNNGKMTRQVTFKDSQNSRQKVALIKSPICKETTFSQGVKQGNKKDFCRSAKSPETFTSFKKTIKPQEMLQTKVENPNQQSLNTIKNTKERTPQLRTKQWVTQEKIWKVDRDIKEDSASFHKNSAAKCQTHAGAEQEKEELLSEEERTTLELEDLGGEESECRREKENYESKEGGCRSNVCPFSYTSSCEGAKEHENGLKEPNMSILVSDSSAVLEEQFYSSALVEAHIATDTPEKHCPRSTSLEAGEAQTSSLPEHRDKVGIAPACIATTPECGNTTRLADGDICHIELLPEDLLRDQQNKDAQVTRSITDPYQSQGTLEVRNAKMEPRPMNAPQYPIQTETQERVKAKNYWPRLRVNHGILSKFRFMSLRSDLRNDKMPHT